MLAMNDFGFFIMLVLNVGTGNTLSETRHAEG
jgi:hypothetical protein